MSEPPRGRDDTPEKAEAPVGGGRVRARLADADWLHEVQRDEERSPRVARREARRQAGRGPRVGVCDEGELEDVYGLLCELGETPLRLRPSDLAELRDWERPTRLLVTSVRIALAQNLPLPNAPEKSVAIAVADSDAHLQCNAMLRRGFRYVVRRPVHPEALRLLLMQVLWKGPEGRVVARFPFGAEVRWRVGLRRGRCTMVEVSAHGCRLITREHFRLGDRIHLRVSAALTGSRDLRLRGRVVRRDRLVREGAPDPQVAVQFERLSGRSVAHLDALLAERASGPAVMSGERSPGAGASGRRRRGEAPRIRLGEAQPAAAGSSADAPEMERRRRPRGVWQRELVALDPESDRVLHTFIGSDLSIGGVRVEPHPLLRLGDRLRIALYDAKRAEPMVVEARVAHDQGRRGVGLVFVDPSDEQRGLLRALVEELPPVSSLSPEAKPKGMLLGEIMEVRSELGTSAERREPDAREPEHDHDATDHDDEEA